MRYYKREIKAAQRPLKKKQSKARRFNQDLWADDTLLAADLPGHKKRLANFVANCEDLQDDTRHHLINPIKHKVNRKTSQLAAIETPHPGLSYNPTFKDHQAIVMIAVEDEKRRLNTEQKLIRATQVIKSVKSEDEEEVEIKEETDEDEDRKLVLQPKPKTRQQKRRQKVQLELQRNSRLRKAKNAKESEVFRVKSLVKDIELKDSKARLRLSKKIIKIQEREKTGVKNLGKHKFVEMPADPILSDNLPGSLRAIPVHLTSTSNILVDRFKSLQKRNVVETRVKVQMVRKNKLKKYQRPSEKMEWEKTGEWNGIKLPNDHGRKKGRGSFRRRK
jgi:nucleolar protein 53